MQSFINKFQKRELGASLSRILIGALLMKDFLIYFLNADLLFGPKAIFPIGYTRSLLENLHLEFLLGIFSSLVALKIFLALGFFLSFFFFSGLAIRLSGLLLFASVWLLKERNIYIMDGADNVIWIMLPLMALVKSRPLFGRKHQRKNMESTWNYISNLASFGIVLQLCFIYLFTAASKLIQPVWLNGTALYYIMRLEDFRSSDVNFLITQNSILVYVLTYLTLWWEASFPFLIWFKRGRNFAVILGLIMHLGIFLFLRIDNFSFVMLSFYPMLYTNTELRRIYLKWIPAFLRKRKTNKGVILQEELKEEGIILFDGICNFCNATVLFIMDKDPRKVFHFASLQSDFGKAMLRKNNLPEDNLDTIYLLKGDRIYSRSDAMIAICSELEKIGWLAKLMRLFPSFIRNTIYSFISRHRYRIFGKDDKCRLVTQENYDRFIV